MGSADAANVNREPTRTSELQKLVPPDSGLGKVSSRDFEDFDGSTKPVDVLYVSGAKAIIIVRKVRNGWRPEPLYGELSSPTSENLEEFTRRARNLGIDDSTRPPFTDGLIGQELKRLADNARLSRPGTNYNRSVRKPLQAR